MEVSEILRRPYQRVLIPDEESGTFTAMLAEFPGCISEGDSPADAYANLESAVESWVEAAIESGIPIPEPEAEAEYSGRVVLRMPRSTHRRAVEAASRENVSLNQFLVAAVSERIGGFAIGMELEALRSALHELQQAVHAPRPFYGIMAGAHTPSERFETLGIPFAEGAGTVSLSNLSNVGEYREIPGSHLGQLTNTEMPLLQEGPGVPNPIRGRRSRG